MKIKILLGVTSFILACFPAPIPFRKKEKQDKEKDDFILDRFPSLQGLWVFLFFEPVLADLLAVYTSLPIMVAGRNCRKVGGSRRSILTPAA